VAQWIEVVYKRQRLHFRLSMVPTVEFEADMNHQPINEKKTLTHAVCHKSRVHYLQGPPTFCGGEWLIELSHVRIEMGYNLQCLLRMNISVDTKLTHTSSNTL